MERSAPSIPDVPTSALLSPTALLSPMACFPTALLSPLSSPRAAPAAPPSPTAVQLVLTTRSSFEKLAAVEAFATLANPGRWTLTVKKRAKLAGQVQVTITPVSTRAVVRAVSPEQAAVLRCGGLSVARGTGGAEEGGARGTGGATGNSGSPSASPPPSGSPGETHSAEENQNVVFAEEVFRALSRLRCCSFVHVRLAETTVKTGEAIPPPAQLERIRDACADSPTVWPCLELALELRRKFSQACAKTANEDGQDEGKKRQTQRRAYHIRCRRGGKHSFICCNKVKPHS